MASELKVVPVGKWSLAYHHPSKASILRLEWADREPLNLAFPPDDAVQLAKAILAQYGNEPPKRDRLA